MRNVRSIMAVVLVVTGCQLALSQSATAGVDYRTPAAPVQARVADLLHRMSLDEKIGQLEMIAVPRVQGDCAGSGGDLVEACLRQVLVGDAAGSLLSGGGQGPASNTPAQWATMTNAIQRYAVEHSRLHIPILYGVDAVHGHNNVLGAPMYPHQLGLGASWDPDMVARTGRATGEALAATGTPWDFAPVADQCRDPRWGRCYEAFAEDPVLTGELAAAAVTGLRQVPGIAATVKHYPGLYLPVNGHDRVAADVSARTLVDQVLPPYRAAVRAGAQTVMAYDTVINGVPGTASHELLTDILRGQLGFTGVVVSDWNAVANLNRVMHVAADYPSAIAMAINAGVDVAMLPPDDRDFPAAIRTAVARGMISRARVDEAAGRVLTLKFTLGLFEHPYVDPGRADAAVAGSDANRQLARAAAAESMVLLRNEGSVLPIGAGTRRIVVTGPAADSMPWQLGGWSIGWQGVPEGITVPGTTVLAGIRAAAPAGTEVRYAAGSAEAVAASGDADLVVAVVGEPPGAEGLADRPRPELAADQQQAVAALRETGRPVVVVVVSGRPLVLGAATEAPGLLAAWLPGSEGGAAVADVLFGAVNPSGRLPISWPRAIGNEPQPYLQLPGPFGSQEAAYQPAYPFGAGLSYTGFQFSAISVTRQPGGPGAGWPGGPGGPQGPGGPGGPGGPFGAGGPGGPGAPWAGGSGAVLASVTVANTGGRDGVAVVPVYLSRPQSSVVTPPKRLVGFTRVAIPAGQSRTVVVPVPQERLLTTRGDVTTVSGQWLEPGTYQFSTGELSSTGPRADLTIR